MSNFGWFAKTILILKIFYWVLIGQNITDEDGREAEPFISMFLIKYKSPSSILLSPSHLLLHHPHYRTDQTILNLGLKGKIHLLFLLSRKNKKLAGDYVS